MFSGLTDSPNYWEFYSKVREYCLEKLFIVRCYQIFLMVHFFPCYVALFCCYYVAVLIGCITSLVCPVWAPNWKTKKFRKNKIIANVPLGMSNQYANFQFKTLRLRSSR